MTDRSAFIHKPKSSTLRSGYLVDPQHTRKLFLAIWAEARKQPWWEKRVGLVGNDRKFFYFQINGLETGFARLEIKIDPEMLHESDKRRDMVEEYNEHARARGDIKPIGLKTIEKLTTDQIKKKLDKVLSECDSWTDM
jgi:hypothetical protein